MLTFNIIYGIRINNNWMKHNGKYLFTIFSSELKFNISNYETKNIEVNKLNYQEIVNLNKIINNEYQLIIVYNESNNKIKFLKRNNEVNNI